MGIVLIWLLGFRSESMSTPVIDSYRGLWFLTLPTDAEYKLFNCFSLVWKAPSPVLEVKNILQARKDRSPEKNVRCLPLGLCVQSGLSQTGSSETLQQIFLISSDCLTTSKATSKRSDRLPTRLKPRRPCLFNSNLGVISVSSHQQSHRRKRNWEWQSQYALVRGLSLSYTGGPEWGGGG